MNSKPIFSGGKVLFMRIPGASPEIRRMTCLASLDRLYKPTVRAKQYFDEPFRRSDVVGRSLAYKFEMILRLGDPLHDRLAELTENSFGSDEAVTLYEADVSRSDENGYCPCTEALFTLIPEKRYFDENGMLRCSGEFAQRSIPTEGLAVLSNDGSSLEFSRIR